MRVAITTNTLKAGGAEKQRIELANALADLGAEVQLVTLQEKGELHSRVNSQVDLRSASFRGRLPIPTDIIVSGTTRTECFFSSANTLAGRARGWVVVVHNPTGPGAPRLAPGVVRLISGADVVAALSEMHLDSVPELGVRASVTLPNGVDGTDLMSVRRTRQDLRDSFPYDYGFIGRLARDHKGLDIILDAWQELAESEGPRPVPTIVIFGSGDDGPWLRDQISRRHLSSFVSMGGFQPPEAALRQFRTLVMPSRYEGQPMILEEAYWAGVPVIASQYANAESGPGVQVFRPFTSASLASAVAGGTDGERAEFGRGSSSASVAKYDSSDMAREYLRLAARVLENPLRRRSRIANTVRNVATSNTPRP
ncbi:glycosyltransferase involved in cell wall biosynthesis [Nocardioides zeae]|uniref:Glycosyltransferase involved in cell wall biosynthesis n=1 Tax=Nocardioides zeae TaxID=1457234 RepID=A0ACC6IJX2_9ACTN|nr:glycosyltransferase involved in cell wall biosynthesis [Nocardioides zeae]